MVLKDDEEIEREIQEDIAKVPEVFAKFDITLGPTQIIPSWLRLGTIAGMLDAEIEWEPHNKDAPYKVTVVRRNPEEPINEGVRRLLARFIGKVDIHFYPIDQCTAAELFRAADGGFPTKLRGDTLGDILRKTAECAHEIATDLNREDFPWSTGNKDKDLVN